MGATLLGAVFGFIMGAAFDSMAIAVGGAMVGMTIGLALHGWVWVRARAGDEPVTEHHLVQCTPNGRAADVELEGDRVTGKWYDVHSCSLLHPHGDVYCDKTCLKLMNDVGPKPGEVHPAAH